MITNKCKPHILLYFRTITHLTRIFLMQSDEFSFSGVKSSFECHYHFKYTLLSEKIHTQNFQTKCTHSNSQGRKAGYTLDRSPSPSQGSFDSFTKPISAFSKGALQVPNSQKTDGDILYETEKSTFSTG